MKDFPEIHTARLILRQPVLDDIQQIIKLANEPEISNNTTNLPYPYSWEDAVWWLNMSIEGFLKEEKYIFAIALRESNLFIGGMGFTLNREHNMAEIGYWIGKNYWNKGYCTEALPAIIRYGFEHTDVNKFMATHFIQNPASGRVMEKCGMTKEGMLEQHIRKGEQYLDIVQFGLTKTRYLEKNL